MERLQIQFTPEQARRLRRCASERGASVAKLVREAVDAHITEPGTAERRRAVDAIGGFRSGMRDVSERHDDYLAEDFS